MDTSYSIPREEYKLRRMRCAEEAKKRGLKGLLVWSKGGGNVDRYANVMYLANYYSPFPHIPDNTDNTHRVAICVPHHRTGKQHRNLVFSLCQASRLMISNCPFLDEGFIPRAFKERVSAKENSHRLPDELFFRVP